MPFEVSIKGGRLVVRDSGKLVFEKGGSFIDADSDDHRILTLDNVGRLAYWRRDGTKERDIAAKGVRVRIVGDLVCVTQATGRVDEYRGDRIVRSLAS